MHSQTPATRWGIGTRYLAAAVIAASTISACGERRSTTAATPTAPSVIATTGAPASPVFVVAFTHIEDNTPAGVLGAANTRTAYANVRSSIIDIAERTRRNGVPWSLQPDWKLLEAALQYEDAAMMATTGGINVLRHLRDTLGVRIDPHSHEGGGYNYSDVASLLERLGVGGSTVIGGHIWDPSLPQFQQWDRFRGPVAGQRYPSAVWRGDILMGSGTPNHVNDPIVSGVWRPRDRSRYFEDDPAGNITAIGAFRNELAGVAELVALNARGQVPATCMLTASIGIRPAEFLMTGGSMVENTIIAPLAAERARGAIELTDFTTLVSTWRQRFGARACTFDGQRLTVVP